MASDSQSNVTDDMDAVMINLLAALADLKSHYQDLVAQESYLRTSRDRRSLVGRQRAARELRRRLEKLKLLQDQLESVISDD